MMHVMVNVTWACQLACPYCLIPHIKVDRSTPEQHWRDWARGLINNLEPGDIADIAGGDPLLFDGLAEMLDAIGHAGIRWALTTNALYTTAVFDLVRTNPPGCIQINVSDHIGNKAAIPNINRLSARFPVYCNRVDHPQAGQNIPSITTLVPYQAWKEGTALDGNPRYCDAGQGTWTAGPNGDVWRCSVSMSLGHKPIGNLFREKIIKPEPFICEFGCTTCYEPPEAYFIQQYQVEAVGTA